MKKMSRDEVLAETEWLLDGHMHPIMIAETLHRSVGSIAKMAWRVGNKRVFHEFGAALRAERGADK